MSKLVLPAIIIVIAAILLVYFDLLPTGGQSHTVSLSNESQEYVVSPGVLVVHNKNFSTNHLGQAAPAPYESLAEVGNPDALISEFEDDVDVYKVFKTADLAPNSEERITISGIPEGEEVLVSYLAMVVQTNDGVLWVNSASLTDENGPAEDEEYWAEILDMGTEQNAPIGSGFDGGQFDSSRGVDNLDNGVATREFVQHHTQFYDDPSIFPFILLFGLNTPAERDDSA